jgi:hypothetical protein
VRAGEELGSASTTKKRREEEDEEAQRKELFGGVDGVDVDASRPRRLADPRGSAFQDGGNRDDIPNNGEDSKADTAVLLRGLLGQGQYHITANNGSLSSMATSTTPRFIIQGYVCGFGKGT